MPAIILANCGLWDAALGQLPTEHRVLATGPDIKKVSGRPGKSGQTAEIDPAGRALMPRLGKALSDVRF